MRLAHLPRAARRALGRTKGASHRALNAALAPLERRALGPMSGSAAFGGPLFIVGAPRSGTTLLYQLMVAAFDLGYITNRHCRWYRLPVFVETRRPTPLAEAQPSFESAHGTTAGAHAPSECGIYWYRFLPRRPHALGADSVSAERIQAMRTAVHGLSAAMHKPLIFKNVILSLRIPLLTRAFPESRFIVMRRDVSDTAVSILRARQKIHGRLDRWFSVEPPGSDSGDPFEAVARQILGTYAAIEAARAGQDERFYEVSYEQLCASPADTLDGLQAWFAAHQLRVPRRTGFCCPEQFDRRGLMDLPADWQDALSTAFARLEKA